MRSYTLLIVLGLVGKFKKKSYAGELNFKSDLINLYDLNSFYEDDLFVLSVSGTITTFLEPSVKSDVSLSTSYEQILELYKKHSNSFYKHIDGPYFILLWDKKLEKLLLCNNRHQSSNLYYYVEDDSLIFSKSLLKISKLIDSRKPHMPSILSFLSNGFTLSDETQLAGVKKLLPTFCLIWAERKVILENHWDEEFLFERKSFENLEEHLDKYEKTYQDVLTDYLFERKPKSVGCLLSGGHDTSFLAAQLSNVLETPLETFTVTFPEWTFNEEKYAENIAKKFNCVFNAVPFLPKHMDKVVEMIAAVEEPAVGVALPLFILGQEASKKVDVILGGDGGDTVWGEYYPVAEFHRYIKYCPLFIRKFIHLIAKGLAKLTDWERFWELEHVASLFTTADYYNNFMRKLCTYRHFRDETLEELFVPEIYGTGEIAKSILEVPFTRKNFRESLIEGKLFNAFYTYMGFSQTKIMKSENIDFFMPTVQKPTLSFISKLPYKWINGGNTFQRLTNSKSINRKFHKKALQRYFKKDEIYNRSFDIPWNRILKPRKDILDGLSMSLNKRGWYNKKTLDKLWREFEQEDVKEHEILELKNHGYRIMTLLTLEVWSQIYLDGKDLDTFNGSLSDFLKS